MSMTAFAAADEITELKNRAQNGEAKAQIELAIRLRDGKGVTKNDADAMQWAHKAADAGNADAQDFVGFAYLRGAVVKRNTALAIAYFKEAADESAQAAFNLGQCYFGAQGTEQDCAKALEYWEKAASKGHGRAAAAAAMAFHAGEGIRRDAKKARQLAERAAELGNAGGLVFLGELQFQAGDMDTAKANWTKASKLMPTSATGHPSQPSDNASAQQGADLLKLVDYRRRKGEPGKFAFVQMPHILQGYNNCGSTACAIFARFQGSDICGWDFKKLCPSPLGTGTDWGHLLDTSAKIGQQWKLVTFTPDDDGFIKATGMLKSELDAGRPVIVDFKYIGPQYPGGSAGHTLNVCGYIAQDDLYILCNPAVATPGLQLITAADLKNFWRSDHYGALSKGVLSRPAFVIDLR
ncbi:MAG: Localization factor PodJL [Verrucomicrobiota bacterium]|jgi:TPR repeat protein